MKEYSIDNNIEKNNIKFKENNIEQHNGKRCENILNLDDLISHDLYFDCILNKIRVTKWNKKIFKIF